MSRPPPTSINFTHPFPQRQPSSSNQQSYNPGPSPHQHQLQLNPQAGPSRSPGKGKSPANRSNSQSGITQSSQPQNQSTDHESGLSLDPDAFSRDIRFQVPSFLSNQVGGAPTFPPGGEAWSGFGANLFSNDGSGGQQLTPGSLFNHAFGLTGDNTGYGGNENSGGGRNVLEGLSNYMDDGGSWNGWDKDASTGLTPGNNNSMPTTFYINPNPSPNVLAARQQPQQQSHQQMNIHHSQQNQSQQPQSSLQHRSSSASSGQSRPSLPNINTAQNHSQVAQSPRTMNAPHLPSPRMPNMPPPNRPTNMPSPHSTTSSIPTSALFPQAQYSQSNANGYYVPTIAAPSNPQSVSTINIASSSTQPYAPPPNTQALLQGPALPNLAGGPSLTDGPGLYSTTGFDMVGVLGRVAARKDPKTVLGPVDLSCSFLVVVSPSA